MKVSPLATLLAAKVINLGPGLGQSDQRVGLVLLEHFNRKSGRCDPSLERIATLLGYSKRTVIRAVQRLERAGLFRKQRHGGYSHRNSYEPNWSRFAELEAAWKNKFREGSRTRSAKLSPSGGKPCHVAGDAAVTQTCINNLQRLTFSKRNSNEARRIDIGSRISKPNSSVSKSAGAALVAAERRWTTALNKQFSSMPVTYGEIIQAIDAAMQAAATDAEMKRHGAGFTYIMTHLQLHEFAWPRSDTSEEAG